VADAQKAVQTKMWPLMKANWLLWPAVQIVSRRALPRHIRLLAHDIVD
jgi:hypothetical protein